MNRSRAYIDLYKRGPFAGMIDPWAEVGRYFHQIHAGMIGALLIQLQDDLIGRGYQAGRETSLQVMEHTQPDLFIHRPGNRQQPRNWDYPAAAQAVLMEPGEALSGLQPEPELDALFIKQMGGTLVTVVEVISPSNKVRVDDMERYQARRQQLIAQGVNVVEVDCTRSIKRLVNDLAVQGALYHVVIHLPGQTGRWFGSGYGEAIKSVALPLRGEALPMNPQAAYDAAYQQAAIAGQIHDEARYTIADLPFVSLLTESQQRDALARVAAWIEELKGLVG
ncbi:MAG TPA: DUF4058 family protein [Aggregatilineales bacterium]|nr:DUF4058 family protein [Aggregatilineales bacterium]